MNQNGLNSEIHFQEKTLNGSDKELVKTPYIEGFNSYIYNTNDSIYTAKTANDYIYLATSNGIHILNRNFELVNKYDTLTPVKDIVISSDGKYLYTAECDAGVGIYSISGSNLERLSMATTQGSIAYNFTVTSISLSADETTLLCQAGFSRLANVDIRNKKSPVMTTFISNGSMYYRNLCQGLIDNKYVASVDSGKISLFSSNIGVLTNEYSINNSVASETNGMAAYKDKIVSVCSNGYIYFDPTNQNSSLSSIKVNKIPGIMLKGKPVIYGSIMVVSYCTNGEFFIIDISDIDNPQLIGKSKIDGSIDVATVTDNLILIPLRNNGLLILEKMRRINAQNN